MHAQNKGVAVHTVDMDFKKVKRNLNIKILLQYVWKGNGPGCKINIGENKRRMAAQKVDMGELLGKRPLLTFSWCHQEIDGRKSPKHSWKWNLNPKTETILFLFQLSQIISHENRNIYLLTFFLCWLFIQAWKEQDEDERLDISVCTVLQQRLWWALIWQNV